METRPVQGAETLGTTNPPDYLLFAGSGFYPRGGMDDLVAVFKAPVFGGMTSVRLAALAAFQTRLPPEYEWDDGEDPDFHRWRYCSWYHIVCAYTLKVVERGEGLDKDGHRHDTQFSPVVALKPHA